MAAVVLTLGLAALLAAIGWLVLGSRFRFSGDPRQNDLQNLIAYVGILLPFVFVVVFYLLEHL